MKSAIWFFKSGFLNYFPSANKVSSIFSVSMRLPVSNSVVYIPSRLNKIASYPLKGCV